MKTLADGAERRDAGDRDGARPRRRRLHNFITSSLHHFRSFSARGFTIIELLVVLSIIVVLATIGMTQYRSSVIRANEAVLMEDLFRLRDAIDQYYADKGQWPSSLDSLVSDGYIRAIPKDPFTKNTDWQTVPSDADPNNPSAAPGVYNVKSGSDQTGLDGTKYSDW